MNPTGRRSRLAIFPLDVVVLFPRVRVPLRIFEPRYRQMTEAVLAGDRRIGLVTVRPEHTHDMASDPPIFEVGCEGRVTDAHRLRDGRYELVLLGLSRFRVVREIPRPPARKYRLAEVVALEERIESHAEPRVAALRPALLRLVQALVGRADPARAAHHSETAFDGVDDATFVNTLCQALEMPPVDKQGLLEAPGIPERCGRLIEVLRFRLAELDVGGPFEPGTLH